MKVTTVRFGRTYSMPGFESVRVDLEAILDPEESIEAALDTLAIAARIYKTERFDKGNRGPLNLRSMTDVSVSHKDGRKVRTQLVGDPQEGVKNIPGMPELSEEAPPPTGEEFDPNDLKK